MAGHRDRPLDCPYHPKYKAIHPPRVERKRIGCLCWVKYWAHHPEESPFRKAREELTRIRQKTRNELR